MTLKSWKSAWKPKEKAPVGVLDKQGFRAWRLWPTIRIKMDYWMIAATMLSAVATASTGVIAYFQWQNMERALTAQERNAATQRIVETVAELCETVHDLPQPMRVSNIRVGHEPRQIFFRYEDAVGALSAYIEGRAPLEQIEKAQEKVILATRVAQIWLSEDGVPDLWSQMPVSVAELIAGDIHELLASDDVNIVRPDIDLLRNSPIYADTYLAKVESTRRSCARLESAVFNWIKEGVYKRPKLASVFITRPLLGPHLPGAGKEDRIRTAEVPYPANDSEDPELVSPQHHEMLGARAD